MPLNLLKKYPELLDIIGLSEYARNESLRGVYKRDIEDNAEFKFRGRQIYPIKQNGQIDMDRQFQHLTCEEIYEKDENGKTLPGKRVFDMFRSQRLHWINHHVHEKTPEKIVVREVTERDMRSRSDVTRTYIYDKEEKYVVVLENQRKDTYYLLTAYFLNRDYGVKSIEKKLKKGKAI